LAIAASFLLVHFPLAGSSPAALGKGQNEAKPTSATSALRILFLLSHPASLRPEGSEDRLDFLSRGSGIAERFISSSHEETFVQ
jgi:hypothetical protein